jgi:hypothetical protein
MAPRFLLLPTNSGSEVERPLSTHCGRSPACAFPPPLFSVWPMSADDESAEEEAWCANERDRVVAYLAAERLNHGRVGEWPAWHVWPYVAVWAVESVSHPGWVGWWAISGDLPTDYTTCGPERHPREGVRDIAQRWRASVSHEETDKPASGWRIGSPADQDALAPLLASRADLLLAWVADDSLWED